MEKKKKGLVFFHYLVIALLHVLSNKRARIQAGFVKKLSTLIYLVFHVISLKH